MRKNLVLNLIVAFCVCSQSFAQSNSVLLKDGNGVQLSAHSSITDAYAAVPAALTQPYIIEIDSSYKGTNEVFPITFVNKSGASALNTITVTVADNAKDIVFPIIVPNDTAGCFVLDNADWVIFDGRSSGQYKGMFIVGVNQPDHHFFSLINGSSNNTIRRLTMINGFYFGAGMAVHFGTSPSEPQGNSDNRIEYCSFPECYNGILSEGSAPFSNKNIGIYGCTFSSYGENVIYAKSGTGKVVIDSNYINITHGGVDSTYAIKFHAMTDSAFITRNVINMLGAWHKLCRAIHIQTGGADNYTLLANNMISSADMTYVNNGKLETSNEWNSDFAGVEFAGNNFVIADIYHNTFRMKGVLSAGKGVANGIASAMLVRTEANIGSVYDIKNNIFINERIGGVSGARHAAIAINTVGSLSMDHNAYTTANGQLAVVNNSLYTNLADYKASMGFLEANSDSFKVEFIGRNDMHLSHTMSAHANILGTTVSKVPTDYDGDTRMQPYKGADEFVVNCTASMEGGKISVPDTVCEDAVLSMPVFGQTSRNGAIYQWQQRPAGSTASFTDVANGNTDWLYTSISQPMEFRFKDSCAAGGTVVFSDTVTVQVKLLPVVNGISEIRNGDTYTFAANAQHATAYTWQFGDWQSGSGPNPLHTYLYSGTYEVKLIVSNDCGKDTISKVLQVVTGVKDVENIDAAFVYPNPTNGTFFIKFPAAMKKEVSIEITDVAGRKVFAENYWNNGNAQKITLPETVKGVYFVRLQNEERTEVFKLTVE